jgi:hypothetical protein
MPIAWYLTLVLIAGACALGDQILRGFTLRGFLAATSVALFGTIMGWALGVGMSLPEIIPLHVEGRPFPLLWSFLGAFTLLAALDFVEKRNRRNAGRDMKTILSEASATRR